MYIIIHVRLNTLSWKLSMLMLFNVVIICPIILFYNEHMILSMKSRIYAHKFNVKQQNIFLKNEKNATRKSTSTKNSGTLFLSLRLRNKQSRVIISRKEGVLFSSLLKSYFYHVQFVYCFNLPFCCQTQRQYVVECRCPILNSAIGARALASQIVDFTGYESCCVLFYFQRTPFKETSITLDSVNIYKR